MACQLTLIIDMIIMIMIMVIMSVIKLMIVITPAMIAYSCDQACLFSSYMTDMIMSTLLCDFGVDIAAHPSHLGQLRAPSHWAINGDVCRSTSCSAWAS